MPESRKVGLNMDGIRADLESVLAAIRRAGPDLHLDESTVVMNRSRSRSEVWHLRAIIRCTGPADHYTRGMLNLARIARREGISGAWSTGEQLIVALILDDRAFLAEEDWTAEQVMSRLAGDLGGDLDDAHEWLTTARGHLRGGT